MLRIELASGTHRKAMPAHSMQFVLKHGFHTMFVLAIQT